MKLALILFVYALISAFGLYKMKGAADIASISFVVGLAFYCTGMLVWLAILRIYPLSLAFPAAAGTLIIATQFFGIVMLNEQASWTGMLGVALIASGIVILSLSRGAT